MHHKRFSFQDEYRQFLLSYGVECDEAYVVKDEGFCPYRARRLYYAETPGCRFACPGLCAPLGLQPALANSETSASHYISQKRMALFECFLNSKKNQVKLFSTSSLIINELHNAFGLA